MNKFCNAKFCMTEDGRKCRCYFMPHASLMQTGTNYACSCTCDSLTAIVRHYTIPLQMSKHKLTFWDITTIIHPIFVYQLFNLIPLNFLQNILCTYKAFTHFHSPSLCWVSPALYPTRWMASSIQQRSCCPGAATCSSSWSKPSTSKLLPARCCSS